MKYLIALAMLCLTTAVFAQTTAPTANAGTQALEAIKTLDAGAAGLTATQVSIGEDAHMWSVARNILTKNIKDSNNDLEVQKLDAQKQNEYTSQLNTMTASFNGRCNRTFNRETEMGAYNACVSEKSQLDPMIAKAADWEQSVNRFAAAVNAKVAKNESDRKGINSMQDGIKARMMENEAAGKQYLARRQVLVMQYQALQHGQGRCAELLKDSNTDPETLKEACGILFDGNAMHDTVLVQVPGVPYPVWKHWNDNDPRWHVDE